MVMQATDLCRAWACSALRPRVSASVRQGWSALLDAWITEVDFPLFVRRAGAGRGRVLRHETGRPIVPTDNSPAHWALSLALRETVPTLAEIREWLARDAVPVAMVL